MLVTMDPGMVMRIVSDGDDTVGSLVYICPYAAGPPPHSKKRTAESKKGAQIFPIRTLSHFTIMVNSELGHAEF
jgi:hypothetical protein